MLVDAVNSASAMDVGLVIARPPSLAGRDKRLKCTDGCFLGLRN